MHEKESVIFNESCCNEFTLERGPAGLNRGLSGISNSERSKTLERKKRRNSATTLKQSLKHTGSSAESPSDISPNPSVYRVNKSLNSLV